MGLLNQKINNVIYDFSCVTLNIAGLEITGIQSISWTDGREHTGVYGSGILPLGATPGQWSGSGSLEMILSDYDNLYRSLTRFYDSQWSASITYTLGGHMPIMERLPACIFTGRSGDMSQGSDALVRSMDFLMLAPPTLGLTSPNAENDSILGAILAGANIAANILF